MLPCIRLKKDQERRIKIGHLWIYSNEIDTQETPLNQFKAGDLVTIATARNKIIGTGYINPHSLICVRVISLKPTEILSAELILQRIQQALLLREALYTQPYYRLVFGEADYLPGLVIDRYDAVLVMQITTAGMEHFTTDIVSALQQLLNPHSILLRNDTSVREQEGLTKEIRAIYGEPPTKILLEENGVRFTTSIWEGQKTGWFYDHRSNRARLGDYVKTKSVLDIFSYIGGWGIQAACAGAREVLCLDSSAKALTQLTDNAQLNGVSERVSILLGDAFVTLKELQIMGKKFDVIVLDPPALIKRRKDFAAGVLAYRRLNQMAMQLLNPNGILISASCSLHLSRNDLLAAINTSANEIRRTVQILEQGHQAPDHPVHPAIAETDYLKAFFVRVF